MKEILDANYYLFLTKECNFACSYCIDRQRKDTKVKLSLFKKTFDPKYKRVIITGGEPLLKKIDLYKWLIYLKLKKIKEIYLHTNLSRLSWLDSIFLPLFLNCIVISLPSVNADDYEFITKSKKNTLNAVLHNLFLLTIHSKKLKIIINLIASKRCMNSFNSYLTIINNFYALNSNISLDICLLQAVTPEFFDAWHPTSSEFQIFKTKLTQCKAPVRFVMYPKCIVKPFQTIKSEKKVVFAHKIEDSIDASRYYYLPKCADCVEKNNCPGVLGNYLLTRGENEIVKYE